MSIDGIADFAQYHNNGDPGFADNGRDLNRSAASSALTRTSLLLACVKREWCLATTDISIS